MRHEVWLSGGEIVDVEVTKRDNKRFKRTEDWASEAMDKLSVRDYNALMISLRRTLQEQAARSAEQAAQDRLANEYAAHTWTDYQH